MLLSKYKDYIYNIIFIIINKYIKIMRYFLIIKKINFIKLLKLFYNKVIFKFNKFNNIIINREFIFINIF